MYDQEVNACCSANVVASAVIVKNDPGRDGASMNRRALTTHVTSSYVGRSRDQSNAAHFIHCRLRHVGTESRGGSTAVRRWRCWRVNDWSVRRLERLQPCITRRLHSVTREDHLMTPQRRRAGRSIRWSRVIRRSIDSAAQTKRCDKCLML